MSDVDNVCEASDNRRPLQLPLGSGSALRGITENFSFHSSPESFIASRIAVFKQNQDPDILNKRTPIRAKILNRNVAILSSYKQIKEVLEHYGTLDGEVSQVPAFVAADAYRQLMDQFFPPPNILLADGEEHSQKRKLWEARMTEIEACSVSTQPFRKSESGWRKQVSDILAFMFGAADKSEGMVTFDKPIDLYETMKSLSWRILLGVFLGLSDHPGAASEEQVLFARVERLHEDLLRGQFSLMPLSMNVGFWKSPRSTGIQSRKLLQKLILERLQRSKTQVGKNGSGCVFANAKDNISLEETRDHVLMMTSSLAVKGLASLLTAFLLNLFLFRHKDGILADRLRGTIAQNQRDSYLRHLKSMYLETERLSPPIVGIMRRSTRDIVVQGETEDADTILPGGWDVWSYFVGAGRDPAAFGENWNLFEPERFMDGDIPEPTGFGFGSKSCLGKDFVRQVVLHVADYFLTNDIEVNGVVSALGLKAWLGWEEASPEQWAAEIKQLPTQRPKNPVMVEFVKHV